MSRQRYEDWVKHPLTIYMKLGFEEMYYRYISGEQVCLAEGIIDILTKEPSFVPAKKEKEDEV